MSPRWMMSISSLVLATACGLCLSACMCLPEGGCCEEAEADSLQAQSLAGLQPRVTAAGMFRRASSAAPVKAQVHVIGDHVAPPNTMVRSVQVFAKPGPVLGGGEWGLVSLLVLPGRNWSLLTPVIALGSHDRVTLLVRYHYGQSAADRRVAEQVGTIGLGSTATPVGFSQVTGPGDQITVTQCTGTYYSAGTALYDMSIQYATKPRAIEIYAAPSSVTPLVDPANLIHRETNLPEPVSGVGTWSPSGLAGTYTGGTSYSMTIRAVYAAPTPPYDVTGNFNNIVPGETSPMDEPAPG